MFYCKMVDLTYMKKLLRNIFGYFNLRKQKTTKDAVTEVLTERVSHVQELTPVREVNWRDSLNGKVRELANESSAESLTEFLSENLAKMASYLPDGDADERDWVEYYGKLSLAAEDKTVECEVVDTQVETPVLEWGEFARVKKNLNKIRKHFSDNGCEKETKEADKVIEQVEIWQKENRHRIQVILPMSVNAGRLY